MVQDRRESAQDLAVLLIDAGYEAHTVHDEGLQGADDASLALHCVNEGRALITLDLDFADIRAFPPATSAGLIVLRVKDQSRPHILSVRWHAIELLKHEPVAGRLWIVSEAGVRIRTN